LGAAVDEEATGSALYELRGVSAVFGVPSEPQGVERLEFLVSRVLERCDACVA
jgi:hypothetical protein